MHLRRTLALLTGAIALLTLTSCGFNYATDRVYTPTTGVNDRDGSVDVLSAVIVSSEDGSGTFIASLANNDQDNPATFTGLEPAEAGSLKVAKFDPIEIPAGGLVNLANEGGPHLKGDFKAGDFVAVKVQFESGEQAEMDVPVVPNCGYYEGLDGPSDPTQCEPETPSPSE
jgi:hypothetical protein